MLNIKRHPSLPTYQTPQASAHAARSKSFQATLKTKTFARPEQFATVMWKQIMDRLRDSRVPVNPALLPVRHRFLHLESASPPQAAVFNKIIESPLETTDEEVRTVLPLEEATADSPREDGTHRFYIRSFSLTVTQLKNVVDDWEQNECFYEEADLWARAVEALTDEDFVFIRYVGTYGPNSSALGRFYEDLTQRSTGVFGAFFKTLAMLAPEVIDTAKVYEITNATLQPLSVDLEVSQSLVDERERLLIALLDRRVLLNRQAGGFFATWTAPAADETVFVALKTKMLSEALLRLQSPPSEMTAELSALFDDIFQFMDEHPALTGTTRIQPSPELQASIQAQATPAMMSGKVLLALLGKDITLEDFLSPRPFLSESGSRAGHLLYTLIQVLQRWELGLKAGTTNMGTRPAALFPFFDLIPWPRHEFSTVLCDFLGQYLRIICPLIVMSCSHLTSSVLSANLMHDRGLPRTGFLNEVGRPRLCNVMDPAQYENQPAGDDIRDQDLNIIVVPALHPGRDKYGPQPESLRRVMLLTLQVAVALADIARSVIDGDMSRVDLQTHILAKWNTAPEYKALAKALEEAKALLQADWNKANVAKRRIVTNQEREVRAFNAQTRAKAFVAEGPPRSAVRTAQTLRLWRLNHPDLHIHLGRGQQDDWFDWADSLAEGKSFFASSLARAGGGGLARLCAQLQPGADASDPVVQQTVIEQAVERLRAGWKEDPFSSEKQAKRRLGWRKTGGLVETLNNFPVSVQARGRIVLGFKAGEDEFVNVELWAPKTAVPDGRAIRKITATPDGINLLDEAGNVFKHDVSHIATWSKVDIGRRQNGAFLIKAWEATVKQPFRSSGTPEPSALVIPAAYFGTKNTKSGFKNNTDLRQAAPEPNEVDWIMWSFLQERLGDEGGIFFFCKEEQEATWAANLNNPAITMLRSALRDFVSRPEYRNYPWRAEWIAKLQDNGAHASQNIQASIRRLRSLDAKPKNKSIGGASHTGKLITVAPAPMWAMTAANEEDDMELGGEEDVGEGGEEAEEGGEDVTEADLEAMEEGGW